MSNLPPFMGAPGRAATFTGDNGMMRQGGEAEGAGKAFKGVAQGGPSPMPAEAKSGAFTCDESCQGYSANPRNASGPSGTPAAPNKFPGQ